MADDGGSMSGFATYEDYLDAQVSETDMYYLEDEDLARQLVELGYRGNGDTLSREEFEAQKKMLRERNVQKAHAKRELASADKDFTDEPFLAELASREELLQTGKLTTILFLRAPNAKGQEVPSPTSSSWLPWGGVVLCGMTRAGGGFLGWRGCSYCDS